MEDRDFSSISTWNTVVPELRSLYWREFWRVLGNRPWISATTVPISASTPAPRRRYPPPPYHPRRPRPRVRRASGTPPPSSTPSPRKAGRTNPPCTRREVAYGTPTAALLPYSGPTAMPSPWWERQSSANVSWVTVSPVRKWITGV